MTDTIRSSLGITATWETVTPEIAREWLETSNTVNRRLNGLRVGMYSTDMTASQWEQNGEPYVFDSENVLVNGQHRLTAQVDSGTTLEVLVVRGVQPVVRSTTDANMTRKFSDDLHMNGVNRSVLRESLVRLIVQWDARAGLADMSFRPSRRYLASRYNDYRAELDATLTATDRWYKYYPGNRIAMLFTYWLLRERLGYNERLVNHFFSVLTIGSQNDADNILVRLKRRIETPISYGAGGRSIRMNSHWEAHWLIRGWNAWMSGGRNILTVEIFDPYPSPLNPKGTTHDNA